MAFTIPSSDEALAPTVQSQIFETDLSILVAALSQTGVVSGCGVSAQGSPDMTVAVASGTILAAGVSVAVTSGNLTVGAADATNPRVDLISASAAGVKTITAGVAAATASVKPPDLPSGHIGLAFVYVAANDTAINTNEITDKRCVIPASPRFMGASAYNSGTQSILNATETAALLDSENYDTDGIHSVASATSKFTIPVGGAGKWQGVAYVVWDTNTTGNRYAWWRLNGTRIRGGLSLRNPANAGADALVPLAPITVADGDYIELAVYQDSTGTRTLGVSGDQLITVTVWRAGI